MDSFDVAILGAGASGMMCAMQAAGRGRRVALIDHAIKPGEKISISGGGHCNFTNTVVSHKNYVSRNEHFCKSALSRFTPDNFIHLVRSHGIAFHERKLGQLFCDGPAQQIVNMLINECEQAGASFLLNREIISVRKAETHFLVQTDQGEIAANTLVIATGGLSIPKIGATGLGYDIARQFGLAVVAPAPALDGFTFDEKTNRELEGMAGIALDSLVSCNGLAFRENLLFTHVGFSGPAALQASLQWCAGDSVSVNFVPTLTHEALLKWFTDRKGAKAELKNLMVELVPKRLAERFCELYLPSAVKLANLPKVSLETFCDRLQNWAFIPSGTVGYTKAEVTRGGVDTDELSSKTMEAKKVPGLYFIGEVVDVTGWLGGYNLQWAWASGWAAGQVV